MGTNEKCSSTVAHSQTMQFHSRRLALALDPKRRLSNRFCFEKPVELTKSLFL